MSETGPDRIVVIPKDLWHRFDDAAAALLNLRVVHSENLGDERDTIAVTVSGEDYERIVATHGTSGDFSDALSRLLDHMDEIRERKGL